MENIDAVYFINLDHRTDRLTQIQEEICKMGFPPEKIHRIQAIYKPEIGALGCTLSHIKTLDTFLESNHKTCIVLEDDFLRTMDINQMNFLFKHLFTSVKEFDLAMLAGKVFKKEATNSPFFYHVLDAQTSSAYLITREFAPTLRQNLKESSDFLNEWFQTNKNPKHDFCLDIYWKKLQPQSKWFIAHPQMGIQRESYSDIEQRVTNYGV